MNPFFIDQIPLNAEYAHPSHFFYAPLPSASHSQPIPEAAWDAKESLKHRVQMVDPAWTDDEFQTIKQIEPDIHIARMFEIKDVQLSPVKKESLCSICLFRREVEIDDHLSFLEFVDCLKGRIHQFAQSDYKSQKLRVYIGDDIWDFLHKEKVLEAGHVDFVRMAQSSKHSIIGEQWRILAYDDYDYECVYMTDTDDHHTIPDKYLEKLFPREIRDDVHFSLQCVRPFQDPRLAFANFRSIYESHFDWDFYWVVHPLDYFNFHDLKIIRGSRRLPFQHLLRFIVAPYARRGTLLKLYDPERNIFSYVGTLANRQEWVNYLGFWIFFLRKQLRVRYRYLIEYQELMYSLAETHFLRRLHHQIFKVEGNVGYGYKW